MNQKQAVKFCRSFARATIPSVENKIEYEINDIGYLNEESEKLDEKIKYVQTHARKFNNRYKKYLRDSKYYGERLENGIFNVVFRGLSQYVYSRVSLENNIEMMKSYIADKKDRVKYHEDKIKEYKRQLRKIKRGGFTKSQAEKKAKLLIKALKELNISNPKIEKTDRGVCLSFTIKIINPVPDVVEDFKGKDWELKYDLDVQVYVDGEFYMKLTDKCIKQAKNHQDVFRPHIHADACELKQWTSMCLGDYYFDNYFKELNPVTLLYSVHYMLHTYNKYDDYGRDSRCESYINNYMPKAFFNKAKPKKRKKVSTKSLVARQEVVRWLHG